MTTHKAQTEIDYKAEVLKVYPDAEVVGSILQGRFFATSKRGINGVGGRISDYCQDTSSSWESAYISLPKEETEGAKGRVLEDHPRAEAYLLGAWGRLRKRWVVYEAPGKITVLGIGDTEKEAWAKAASKLPLPNQKEAGSTSPYRTGICPGCNTEIDADLKCFCNDHSPLPDQKREGEGACESGAWNYNVTGGLWTSGGGGQVQVAFTMGSKNFVTMGRFDNGHWEHGRGRFREDQVVYAWAPMLKPPPVASLAPGIREGGGNSFADAMRRKVLAGGMEGGAPEFPVAAPLANAPHHFTDEQILASCSGEATKQAIYPHLHRMTSEEKDALYGAVGKLAGVEGRGWIKIEPGCEMPPAGKNVAILVDDAGVAIHGWATAGYYHSSSSGWWHGTPGDYRSCNDQRWSVTHWCFLPAPPEVTR